MYVICEIEVPAYISVSWHILLLPTVYQGLDTGANTHECPLYIMHQRSRD